ncbi:MAG: serine/threonine protein kinase [Candidatus Obscuribacterales bacterium]|nr:serine/threonine protein kinase [Candidatus Obscuribacterales bacterium]
MSDLTKAEKYPVIEPTTMATAEDASFVYRSAFIAGTIIWLIVSSMADVAAWWQIAAVFALGVLQLILIVGKHTGRTTLELKAKGLSINIDNITPSPVVPWDWLARVEIRQRKISIIPNYVYFEFKDKSHVLILWEDVRDTIDSTTLISCVRTWAPHATVKGDVKLTKSESIATYTELWLKDMSLTKSERRLRQDQTIAEGTVLSDSYTVERILSGGGQGTAYLASVLPQTGLPDMPSQVVLKEFILPANDRGLKKATDNLIKEVSILRRISHPMIIRLYDFFIEDMRGYFVIEYIDGDTLRQLVARSGPINEAIAAKIGASLCETLSYMHQLAPPIIHGDVTPDNIMIDKSGSVRLMDFDASQELTRNKTNTVVGKHSYMSPEQFKGELGESSDLYALGCTLHFMLTGLDPEPITESRPSHHSKSVSKAMDSIISTATKFNRTERYSNLGKMRAQLERLQ